MAAAAPDWGRLGRVQLRTPAPDPRTVPFRSLCPSTAKERLL